MASRSEPEWARSFQTCVSTVVPNRRGAQLAPTCASTVRCDRSTAVGSITRMTAGSDDVRATSVQPRSRPGSSGARLARMRFRSCTDANSTVRRPRDLPRLTLTRVSNRSDNRAAKSSRASFR